MRWCVGGVGLSNPLKPFNQTIESIQTSHSVLQTNRNNPCKCFNRSIYHSSLSVQSMSPINHLNPFAPCSQLMHLPQPTNTVCQSNHPFQFKLARTFQCNPFSHSTQSHAIQPHAITTVFKVLEIFKVSQHQSVRRNATQSQ